MDNVNDTYFDGHYKEIWRTMIPEELTLREVDFMISYFKLQPGDRVLDLMCGYGRHAIALARKGINVTAVDNLEDYTQEIEAIAVRENLPVSVVNADILGFAPSGDFKLIICMGNSLNFFNEVDISSILANMRSVLKPGGQFLINTWSLAETVIKNFRERTWDTVIDLKCLSESKYLFYPTRIETDSIFIAAGGSQEVKTAIDYIYSVNEFEGILNRAALGIREIFSIPGKKLFGLGDPRAYIIASHLG